MDNCVRKTEPLRLSSLQFPISLCVEATLSHLYPYKNGCGAVMAGGIRIVLRG